VRSHICISALNGKRVSAADVFLFILASDFFLHVVKSYDMRSPALLPHRRKVCCGFLSPLKVHRSAGFELANVGSNGKHTNHYTTEAAEPRSYSSRKSAPFVRTSPPFLRSNIGPLPWNRPWLPPSKSLPAYHSDINMAYRTSTVTLQSLHSHHSNICYFLKIKLITFCCDLISSK
jgi:hypothetical protein